MSLEVRFIKLSLNNRVFTATAANCLSITSVGYQSGLVIEIIRLKPL